MLFNRFLSRPPEHVQQPPATKEEAKIPHSIHQPPDLRVRKEVPLPEVPIPSRSGRNRAITGVDQCPGHHVVPEQKGEAEEGHGGTQERRRARESGQPTKTFNRQHPRPKTSQEI